MHRDDLGAAHARIAELEGTVRELEDQVRVLEAKLAGEPPPPPFDEVAALEKEMAILRGKIPPRGPHVVPVGFIAFFTVVSALAQNPTAFGVCCGLLAIVSGVSLIERRGARRAARRELRRVERRLAEARARREPEPDVFARVSVPDAQLDGDDVSQRGSARERR
jgi:hypothetical protein